MEAGVRGEGEWLMAERSAELPGQMCCPLHHDAVRMMKTAFTAQL